MRDLMTHALSCKVLRFDVGQRPYVAEIDRIREIVFSRAAVPVPQAPSFLDGLMDLRGKAIPLIDLRERLGVPESSRVPATHILIIRIHDRLVGLVVDKVHEVLEVDGDHFRASEEQGAPASMCRGVCRVNDEMIVVLDLRSVLAEREYAMLKDVV